MFLFFVDEKGSCESWFQLAFLAHFRKLSQRDENFFLWRDVSRTYVQNKSTICLEAVNVLKRSFTLFMRAVRSIRSRSILK